MATLTLKRKVANPAKRKAKSSRNRAPTRKYRAKPKAKVNRAKPRKTRKVTAHRKRKRTANPVPVAVILESANPRGGGRKMAKAKAKRRSNPKRRYTAKRRSNPVARKATRRRVTRRNPVVKHHRRKSRRNPAIFGQSAASGSMLKMILGGLVGVAATKIAVAALPSEMTSNTVIRVIASGALAFVLGMLASKSGIGQAFADGVTFGGLMQAASTALALVPGNVASPLALNGRRGMGDLTPAKFALPENPIKQAARQLTSAATMPAIAPGNGVGMLRPVYRRQFAS